MRLLLLGLVMLAVLIGAHKADASSANTVGTQSVTAAANR
jgi:hypothetical protein